VALCHRRPVRVTVEPEALAGWSADARRTTASLHQRLGRLDEGLAPLARTWDGAAADGFAARHRQWHDAAMGLLDTLTALTLLVDTARANYLAASSANMRIWRVDGASTAVVLRAMGTGRGRISADIEEVRATVRRLVIALDGLGAAWVALADGLAGTATMAGGDDVGTAFAADYNGMVDAAWQGWRRSVLLLDGIAGGLAATGNNMVQAEIDSTPGRRWMFPPIALGARPTPSPAAPPVVGGGPAGGAATAYWPTADTELLRGAAQAWRGAADRLHGAVWQAFAAVGGLVAANPDPVLADMRRFAGAALSDDPTSGLTGVLAGAGDRIASACEGLATLTERTRGRIVATITYYAGGEEWYHPVADVLDLLVRFRAAHAIAAAADAYLLDLDLSAIHDDHVRAVDSLRGELHPAAADRLARIATAMAPPRPVPADTCAVTPPDEPAGAPVPEAQRAALIAEAAAVDPRATSAEVVQIARGWDGRPVWIPRGNAKSGLQHLLRAERILAFLDQGVAPADIPALALRAVAQGPPIGRSKRKDEQEEEKSRRQGKEPGFVYSVDIGGGRRRNIVVVRTTTGAVLTAFPFPRKKPEPL
jgi:early secretory antigenic target protein ESAT-6